MIHTAIQARTETADPLSMLLSQHRAALVEVIAIAADPVDRVAAIRLKPIAAKARFYLAEMDRHERNPVAGPFGSEGTWGENGRAPKIADMLCTARFLRDGSVNLPARLDRIAADRRAA